MNVRNNIRNIITTSNAFYTIPAEWVALKLNSLYINNLASQLYEEHIKMMCSTVTVLKIRRQC